MDQKKFNRVLDKVKVKKKNQELDGKKNDQKKFNRVFKKENVNQELDSKKNIKE